MGIACRRVIGSTVSAQAPRWFGRSSVASICLGPCRSRRWPRWASVLSFIKCRIEAFQLDAGVVRGELPVDLGLDAVSGRLPSRDLVVQDLEGVNAAVEALTGHDVELDLGDVEPTAMLWRVDELEAVPQALASAGGKAS